MTKVNKTLSEKVSKEREKLSSKQNNDQIDSGQPVFNMGKIALNLSGARDSSSKDHTFQQALQNSR
jgi:hypothetical protein